MEKYEQSLYLQTKPNRRTNRDIKTNGRDLLKDMSSYVSRKYQKVIVHEKIKIMLIILIILIPQIGYANFENNKYHDISAWFYNTFFLPTGKFKFPKKSKYSYIPLQHRITILLLEKSNIPHSKLGLERINEKRDK